MFFKINNNIYNTEGLNSIQAVELDGVFHLALHYGSYLWNEPVDIEVYQDLIRDLDVKVYN